MTVFYCKKQNWFTSKSIILQLRNRNQMNYAERRSSITAQLRERPVTAALIFIHVKPQNPFVSASCCLLHAGPSASYIHFFFFLSGTRGEKNKMQETKLVAKT